MSQTVINFNTDSKLKSDTQKTLNEMGLTLSSVFNNYMRQIVAGNPIEYRSPEIPNARLRKSFRNADKMIKSGKYTVYKTHEDLEKHLLSL